MVWWPGAHGESCVNPFWSVPRLSLRFYSLKPTFVTCDGSTNRKWHRSLSIWLQQVRQRWWAGHFDSIIWVACHFAEDVSTYQEYVALYQEHVWTHWTKLLQRSINIWQVTLRRGDNVSGRACNLLTSRKMLQRIRNVWQATWRRCCKIPGTSFKGLEEDVTTSCMEHVASVAQKMSQCIRNMFELTGRSCFSPSVPKCPLSVRKCWAKGLYPLELVP